MKDQDNPTLVSQIDSPSQLKQLTPGQLQQLAGEIRDLIIRTVAKNWRPSGAESGSS